MRFWVLECRDPEVKYPVLVCTALDLEKRKLLDWCRTTRHISKLLLSDVLWHFGCKKDRFVDNTTDATFRNHKNKRKRVNKDLFKPMVLQWPSWASGRSHRHQSISPLIMGTKKVFKFAWTQLSWHPETFWPPDFIRKRRLTSGVSIGTETSSVSVVMFPWASAVIVTVWSTVSPFTPASVSFSSCSAAASATWAIISGATCLSYPPILAVFATGSWALVGSSSSSPATGSASFTWSATGPCSITRTLGELQLLCTTIWFSKLASFFLGSPLSQWLFTHRKEAGFHLTSNCHPFSWKKSVSLIIDSLLKSCRLSSNVSHIWFGQHVHL